MKEMFIAYMREKLADLGIDIESNNYRLHPKWKELEAGFVILKFAMQESWWVERNIVGQERLEKIYGPYFLGLERELASDELAEHAWFEALADKYAVEGDGKNATVSPETLHKYFYRHEQRANTAREGLILRLRKCGIDVDRFDDEQERVKLLYFLFCFERDNHVRIGSFLNIPTLENVDNSFAGRATQNGALMSSLKNEISKGVRDDYVRDVKNTLFAVGNDWEHLITVTRCVLPYGDMVVAKLKRIHGAMNHILGLLSDNHEPHYQDSLLETFYLKLCQHENLGRELDIASVEQQYSGYSPSSAEPYHDRYRQLAKEPIDKDAVDGYLKENRRQLAEAVFQRSSLSSNDYKKYDRAVTLVGNYLSALDSVTNLYKIGQTSKLLVLCILQEIVFSSKYERVDLAYYRAKTSDRRGLQNELTLGDAAHEKSQMGLTEMALRRLYSYTSTQGAVGEAWEIEHAIDGIMTAIFSCHSLVEMNYLHSHLYQLAVAAFQPDDYVVSEITRFCGRLEALAPGVALIGGASLVRLFQTIAGSPIQEDLANSLSAAINDADSDYGTIIPLEMLDERENLIAYDLVAVILKAENKIFIQGFSMVFEDHYMHLLRGEESEDTP